MIQPTVSTAASNYNSAIESQKFSYKAGLTITVNTSGSTPSYTLTSYQRDASGNILYDGSGNPKKNTLTYTGSNAFVSLQKYATSSGNVTGGMYDARRAQGIGLVQVDMGKLNTVLTNGSGNQQSDWSNDPAKTPVNWWNGVLYVQFSNGSARAADGVQVPVDGWGVQLVNGSTIPNPSYTQSQGVYGTTIATNNPVYIVGNYNADGSSGTGANGNPDSSNEPPAAIAADAITVLSTAWNNANSGKTIANRNASSFTEVSAAFLTGLVPSNKSNNGAYSGGVENFPRFLENWSGDTFRYRGSLVSLFESEVAKQPWPNTGTVYNAPNRDWSFDTAFAQGKYPPGTPNSRTYRRIHYGELTAAQYNSELATMRAQMGF